MRRSWPWLLWLACFYATWAALVVGGDRWHALREHWAIAVAMALGSYVAGSTPMGGGTVGFPILVLLLGEPPALGRDFAFAVQAVGMTSASLFVLARRQPLEWVLLRWALLGSLLGTPLGVLLLAPRVTGSGIEIVFAVAWASFGVLHLRRIDDLCANVGETPAAHRFDRNVGFAVGLLSGATVSAITGVGSDMALYAVMVLLIRADLRVAIPSAVALMAFTSLVGIATRALGTGVQPGVFGNWLAAAPIVVLGAPFGAFVVSRIGRRPALRVVAVLCVATFLWTLHAERAALGGAGVAGSLAAVALVNLGFEGLWRAGARFERRSPPAGVSAR